MRPKKMVDPCRQGNDGREHLGAALAVGSCGSPTPSFPITFCHPGAGAAFAVAIDRRRMSSQRLCHHHSPAETARSWQSGEWQLRVHDQPIETSLGRSAPWLTAVEAELNVRSEPNSGRDAVRLCRAELGQCPDNLADDLRAPRKSACAWYSPHRWSVLRRRTSIGSTRSTWWPRQYAMGRSGRASACCPPPLAGVPR